MRRAQDATAVSRPVTGGGPRAHRPRRRTEPERGPKEGPATDDPSRPNRTPYLDRLDRIERDRVLSRPPRPPFPSRRDRPMTRINTNVSSLIAQRVLRKNNDSLNKSLERLSTGLKINTGADNPAGLIASENLRAEKAGITQAIDNAGRASNIIGTAEGGLTEVSSLLTEVQNLVGATANSGGLSDEEKQANQLQVDSILSTINRIAGSTAFQGKKLLNGNYSYTTSSVAASAFDSIQI